MASPSGMEGAKILNKQLQTVRGGPPVKRLDKN
jgi:hypothetical protein